MTNKYKLIAGVIALVAAMHIIMPGDRTISSQGVCTTNVQRDKFAITLQIQSLAPNPAESLRRAQTVADQVARGIMTLEDESIEMQTRNIFSFERQEWHRDQPRNLGIQTQIDLEVTANNRETINAIMNQTQNIQGAQIFPQNLRNFTSKKLTDQATADCLADAIKDAREKAQAMASGDRARVGRLITADFMNARTDSIHPIMARGAVMAMQADSGGDYLQSADGEITIRVNATFRLR